MAPLVLAAVDATCALGADARAGAGLACTACAHASAHATRSGRARPAPSARLAPAPPPAGLFAASLCCPLLEAAPLLFQPLFPALCPLSPTSRGGVRPLGSCLPSRPCFPFFATGCFFPPPPSSSRRPAHHLHPLVPSIRCFLLLCPVHGWPLLGRRRVGGRGSVGSASATRRGRPPPPPPARQPTRRLLASGGGGRGGA